ncbi:MAG: ATP-binding cassette domain-containing protein [Bifidobacteriaceae bacterium]|jgi:ABC-type multidrug transport system ATPase subunit|nr:ATP-binding cassette domain-containing protein [Bifidobacteriaceae bacterium]
MTAMKFEHVSFGYGKRPVLNDVSLQLGTGVHALLGPNGAGKTTLLSLAGTFRTPQSGHVTIQGHDTSIRKEREAARRRIGVLPQSYRLVGSMRVAETVQFAAWSQGVATKALTTKTTQVLNLLGIADLADRRVKSLSGGQRQRLAIATVMVHEPEVLVLDEPTVGLDPEVRLEFRRALAEVGVDRTVIMSTHMLEDAILVNGRVLVLLGGRIVFDGPSAALRDLGDQTPAGDDPSSPAERGYQALIRQHKEVPRAA